MDVCSKPRHEIVCTACGHRENYVQPPLTTTAQSKRERRAQDAHKSAANSRRKIQNAHKMPKSPNLPIAQKSMRSKTSVNQLSKSVNVGRMKSSTSAATTNDDDDLASFLRLLA
jgi:uncharacterized Zn finger protein (UPF0148 family)